MTSPTRPRKDDEPPAPGSTEQLDRLKALLREMFHLDRGDLDFGLYRIMNLKAAEVARFLDHDLLPQVKTKLNLTTAEERAALEMDLKDARKAASKLWIDSEVDTPPAIIEMNRRLTEMKKDADAEADVYNHLANFFDRYYSDGDFVSQRRYSSGGRSAYLFPCDGEEVKLHWANADQYYVKTTENYASYVFTVDVGGKPRRARFEIAAADNEKDNVKEVNGRQRRFVLMGGRRAVAVEKNDLVVRFAHRPLTDGEKKRWPGNGGTQQGRIDRATTERVLAAVPPDWRIPLSAPAPTDADSERTLLAKHVERYTAKNSFDYFIHKDLGGFLRRELDLYLNTDVLNLDDLEQGDAVRLDRALARVRAVRHVGRKVIDFLAQLEDFQKRLWLKKKFVLETRWCVTLDRVPEALHPEIALNAAQCAEWVALFAVDEIAGDLTNGAAAWSDPPSPEFLEANPHLVVDTRHFDRDFTDCLLASGVPARRFSSDAAADLFSPIEIIDLNKLAKKKGVKRVAVSDFGDDNLVLVDEGHLGASGKVWRERRKELSRGGFTFEYSATFNQVTGGKDPDLLRVYGKCLLFDYPYRRFHADGYGKDYAILNLPGGAQDDNADMYLLGCLLTFHQQCLLWRDHGVRWRAFNPAKPLWVLLGKTVSGSSKADRATRSDVVRILNFLGWLLAHGDAVRPMIGRLLAGRSGLLDESGRDFFAGRLEHLPPDANGVYADLLDTLFHGAGRLHVVYLTAGKGELHLRTADHDPFGVVNVGDSAGLHKLLLEAGNPDFDVDREMGFAKRLFADVDRPGSPVNVVIGARRFIAGWNSWRVSTMGLMHVGVGEGPEIIQMFGRGVRLQGWNTSLKRHRESGAPTPPDGAMLAELETLYIFGLRANYMQTFRELLRSEGVRAEQETVSLPVTWNFARKTDLKLIRLRDDARYDRSAERLVLPGPGETDLRRTGHGARTAARLARSTNAASAGRSRKGATSRTRMPVSRSASRDWSSRRQSAARKRPAPCV